MNKDDIAARLRAEAHALVPPESEAETAARLAEVTRLHEERFGSKAMSVSARKPMPRFVMRFGRQPHGPKPVKVREPRSPNWWLDMLPRWVAAVVMLALATAVVVGGTDLLRFVGR